MIRTESEYKEAINRCKVNDDVLDTQRRQLADAGLTSKEIELAMQPSTSFTLQLREEIAWYEEVCRGRPIPIERLTDIGRLLIAARIRAGISQVQLARSLGVSEAAVSRDERNEYHGITVDRAQRILESLGAGIAVSLLDPRNESGNVRRKTQRGHKLTTA
jgi:DNA-binding XRE family transcriptional regulator